MQTAYVRLRALAGAITLGVALIASGQAVARSTASIVLDAKTGRVLQARNADEIRYPASLTKIMTMYLTFEALRKGQITLKDRFTVSKAAAAKPPTKLGLEEGETIRVEDAILGLVTKSANDAAAVVAENLAGSESRFAKLMTRKAKQLGMTHTVFRNASGLPDDEQVTTARDMATLGRAILRDFPEYYHYFSRESFTFRGRTYRNHNNLLGKYEGVDGIKTGYIRASGFNLVASTKRGDTRLISVVLGGRTARKRDAAMTKLLDRTFAKLDVNTEIQVADLPIPTPKPARRRGEDGGISLISSAHAAERVDRKAVWAVQVGAYRNYRSAEKRANRAADLIPGVLADTDVSIQSTHDKKGEVFRARIVGLERDEAADACRLLKRKRFGCMIVPPAKANAVAGGASRAAS